MKRITGTLVLFVLLVLTVVALAKIGQPQTTSALPANQSVAQDGTK
ncbi:MAG TPA: hypothetical protein VLF62_00275 [Candidatus Saccharimonadales bacterium]|nr:hypothetical protein [Candidatus Saccharimonadales bacterium]